MKLRIVAVVLCLLLLAAPAWAGGQASMAEQTLLVGVAPIQALAIHGADNPIVLDIATVEPGEVPTVSATGGTYAITSNAPLLHLRGQIQSDLPDGLVLEILLAAPPGATPVGWVALSQDPEVLVADIGPVATNSMNIQYRLTAKPDAQALFPFYETINVIFTLTDV